MTNKNKQQVEEIVENKEPRKYTVREVLDSLYFEEVDHDGDFDGFIHLTSTLDGSGTKIEMKKLTKALHQAKEEERERIRLTVRGVRDALDVVMVTRESLSQREAYNFAVQAIDEEILETLTPKE